MITKELIELRRSELIKQRDEMMKNVYYANGAIAMLEELLIPPPAPLPPAPVPAKKKPKRKP